MTDALDVAVNLLWLAPGRVGGSEQYLTRQLSGLPDDSGLTPRLFCQATFPAAHPALSRRFPIEPLRLRRDWRGARLIAEHTWLAACTRVADLVHHGGGTVPIGAPKPILLTIHDLQYLSHPEFFSRQRLAYLKTMMPRSAHRASVVATPSDFVRRTVIDAYGIAGDRVVVVPHGIPEVAIPPVDEIAAAADSVGVAGRRFVIYPAITHPHKRHGVLVEMLRHTDPDLALVLVGGEGSSEPALTRSIADAGLTDRVVRTGRVDAAIRDALVAGAEALVFPSGYEGFGAPLVEAMALGTPVVCSDAEAVREVVADAAVVVTASTGEAWAAGLDAARQRRAELVVAGHERRRAFTVAASGTALAAAYRLAAGVGSVAP